MSAISDKHDDLVRGGFCLGAAETQELRLPDGGQYQDFVHATIYWSPRSGAHAVASPIRERYRDFGGPTGQLGYPLTDSQPLGDRRDDHVLFEHASLYRDLAHSSLGVYRIAPQPVPCDDDAMVHGRWDVPHYGSGVVGVHAALLLNNKVVFYTYKVPPNCPSAPAPFGASAVLDLNTGYLSTPSYVGAGGEHVMENLFCAGQAFLPNGRLMVAGGEREDNIVRFEQAVRAIHVFTPGGAGGGTWTHRATCARGRWYPTCATLPDGKVLIVGGSVRVTNEPFLANTTFEIYEPSTNTVTPEADILDDAFAGFSSYPFVIVVPGNKALIHFGTRTRFLDLATHQLTNVMLEAAQRPDRNGRTYGIEGSAVLLPLLPSSSPPYRARVMLIGGGGADPVEQNTPATNSCEVLDLGATKPQWKLVASMQRRRVMPDAVLLPDGHVLVCNGSEAGASSNAVNPVFDAEMYDPETDTWTPLCHASVPRLYHATALLLPDGRVLSAGTDCAWNPAPYHESQLKIELFSPPYCFRSRPDIGYPGLYVDHGHELDVPTTSAAAIHSAVLMRCGSVTHSFNSDQRAVGVPIVGKTATGVRLAVPLDSAVAPPGPYLVFLLDEARTPSVGRFVLLGSIPTLTFSAQQGPVKAGDGNKVDPDVIPTHAKDIDPIPQPWLERLGRLETEVARLSAFVRQHERPVVGAHGTDTPDASHHAAHERSSPSDPHKTDPRSDGHHHTK